MHTSNRPHFSHVHPSFATIGHARSREDPMVVLAANGEQNQFMNIGAKGDAFAVRPLYGAFFLDRKCCCSRVLPDPTAAPA
jgi:hypothetical protein